MLFVLLHVSPTTTVMSLIHTLSMISTFRNQRSSLILHHYCKQPAMKYNDAVEYNHWLRRRIRMCYWKQWRRAKKRIGELIKLGAPKYHAILTGFSRLPLVKQSPLRL